MRKRFLSTALISLALVLLAIAGTVIGFLLLSTLWALVVAGGALLAVLGAVKRVLHVAAERVRWKYRLEDLANSPAVLFARRQHAADEFRRLNAIYQQFLDWSLIITSAVHRPWGNTEPEDVPAWTTNTGVLSFTVGEASISQTELAAAALAVAQRVSTPGWLNRAFDERRQLWLEWYRSLTGGVAGMSPTPEEDVHSSDGVVVHIPASFGMDELEVHWPRQQFLTSIVAGDFSDEYRLRQFKQLRSDVERLDPAKLIDEVHADVPALEGRTAYNFLRPPVENGAIPLFDHERFVLPRYRVQGGLGVDSWVGCSPAVPVEIPPNRKEFPVIEPPDRFLLASFRLDVSDPIPASDCPLVSTPSLDSLAEDDTPTDTGRG
jgi:hypothetical protein